MSNASFSFRWQLCMPLLVLLAGGVRAQARQPNIVYIMADELGYYELSCMGHPRIRTPRIDRMAEEGIRFTQALAGSPLCAPTRGRYLKLEILSEINGGPWASIAELGIIGSR